MLEPHSSTKNPRGSEWTPLNPVQCKWWSSDSSLQESHTQLQGAESKEGSKRTSSSLYSAWVGKASECLCETVLSEPLEPGIVAHA
jgi:hypothetical protein